VRLALCQLNATVGDIAGNAARIAAGIAAARRAGAELVLTPELGLTGYPPEDLLLREHFLDDAEAALQALAGSVSGIAAVVGYPERERATGALYNTAAVLADGEVRARYRKLHLPNYGVFDERRYFTAGAGGATIELGGECVGLTVCEDLWQPGPPASQEAAQGARLLANISASPYHAGKGMQRERLFAQRAREHGVFVAFCGLVGGQDEVVFDGHSFVLDPRGETVARAGQFTEELLVCEIDLAGSHPPLAAAATLGPGTTPAATAGAAPSAGPLHAPLEPVEAEVYAALTVGLRDYVEKNGFAHVVLGLSGGIDSALVACVAVDALGPERVSVAIMPSRFSSAGTQYDAHKLARALGVGVYELPIEAAMDAYAATLQEAFAGHAPDITEENLQARVRGNLLMALSNKFGWLVLTTGNKSEMSVGYTTLYGDLAGGFAVIKDVPKTLVYRLCEWRNSPAGAEPVAVGPAGGEPAAVGPAGAEPMGAAPAGAEAAGAGPAGAGQPSPHTPPAQSWPRVPAPIPDSIVKRAPSAELREDQRDEDSLPPYELLDRILEGYVERDEGPEQLIGRGLPEVEVRRVVRLVDLAEYKRRQAPPGIKITTRAFGRDRRMPITNRYGG
jgi:NAD+ synthase (glutamine-hydrolysing)